MKTVRKFVKDSECCLDLAKKKALNLIDCKDFDYVSVRPRKSTLKTLIIVTCTENNRRKLIVHVTFLVRPLGVD